MAGRREESSRVLDNILKLEPANKSFVVQRATRTLAGLQVKVSTKMPPIVEREPEQEKITTRQCGVCDTGVLMQNARCARCGAIDSTADIAAVLHNDLRDKDLVKEVLRYWRNKLAKNPTAVAHYKIGLIELNLRNSCQALFHFEEASRLGDKSPDVEHAVQTLRSQKIILVVDGDLSYLQRIGNSAVQRGYRFIPIRDGESAIQAFEQYLPDLVIVDVRTSWVDGVDLCSQIRMQRLKRNVPILMLSANLIDRFRAKAAGVTAHMNKPFHDDQLLAKIKQLLDQYQPSC